MSNVVNLNVITRLPCDPQRVTDAANNTKFDRVMIIGIMEDGSEYFASSDPDGGTILWDMERARHRLMQISDEMGE